MSLGKRVKQLRLKKNLTQEELGRLVGVQKAAIYKYENELVVNLKSSVISALAKALDVTPAYLMGWEEDSPLNHEDILPIKKQRIPLLGGVACGEPIYSEEDFKSYVLADDGINADFALRCKGDSMTNIGIKDGYIVFIKQQPAVEQGEVAAFNIDGEFTLKRYFRYGETIVLRSENPEYQDLTYNEFDVDNIICVGKAIAFQGDVK